MRAEKTSGKENELSSKAIHILEGEVQNPWRVAGKLRFTNLADLTDVRFTDGNPDYYHGSFPETLNRKVLEKLDKMIIPSKQLEYPMLPNFMLAKKGPGGSLEVAERQISHDGALGARAMHTIQSFGRNQPLDTFFDENAYTITMIYQRGVLHMFTCHPTRSRELNTSRRTEYVSNLVRIWGLIGSLEDFLKGATAFRNARDWARDQREIAIKQANETVAREAEMVVNSVSENINRNEMTLHNSSPQEVTMSQATQSSSGSSEDELAKF